MTLYKGDKVRIKGTVHVGHLQYLHGSEADVLTEAGHFVVPVELVEHALPEEPGIYSVVEIRERDEGDPSFAAHLTKGWLFVGGSIYYSWEQICGLDAKMTLLKPDKEIR